LLKHLDEHTYLYVKDIVAYVQTTYCITYTVPGITHWLHNHGFSYKKPTTVPGKANREMQQNLQGLNTGDIIEAVKRRVTDNFCPVTAN